MDYPKLMEKARQYNRQLDAIDKKAGAATPAAVGPQELLSTAMAAVEAGIRRDDWDCVAQGQAMLEQLLMGMR